MKAVLEALKAPFADGTLPRTYPASELTSFWKSLTDDEKEAFKANAAAMGFNA